MWRIQPSNMDKNKICEVKKNSLVKPKDKLSNCAHLSFLREDVLYSSPKLGSYCVTSDTQKSVFFNGTFKGRFMTF